MANTLYTDKNSTYLENNPTWHVEDSEWKATQIINILTKNNIKPHTITEVGCGVGEILNQLHQRLPEKNIDFEGYEIAPDAYRETKKREKGNLQFYNDDFFLTGKKPDLLLIIDVIEHVNDYTKFSGLCKVNADYKIFHIPLEISVTTVLRNIPVKSKRSVGHLHHWMKDTALSVLTDSGHEIIDYSYTAGAFHNNKKFRTKLLNFLRYPFYKISPDFAVRLFGGYSLLVLTK